MAAQPHTITDPNPPGRIDRVVAAACRASYQPPAVEFVELSDEQRTKLLELLGREDCDEDDDEDPVLLEAETDDDGTWFPEWQVDPDGVLRRLADWLERTPQLNPFIGPLGGDRSAAAVLRRVAAAIDQTLHQDDARWTTTHAPTESIEHLTQPVDDGRWLYRDTPADLWRLVYVGAGLATGLGIHGAIRMRHLAGQWRRPTDAEARVCWTDPHGRLAVDTIAETALILHPTHATPEAC